MRQQGLRKLWDVIGPFVWILLCMLAGTMIGIMGFGLITGLHGLDNDTMLLLFPWLSLVITLISAVLTVLVLRKSMKLDQLRFGADRKDWGILQYAPAALAGAAAAHVWSSLIYASGITELFTGYSESASNAFTGQPMPLLILTTVIAAPIAEELVFREMIYRRAKLYFSIPAAAVLSAVLFGLYHANVVQFVYALGFSVFLIFVYEKSGNILAPILAHGAANLWAVILDQWLPEYSSSPSAVFLAGEAVLAAVLILFLVKTDGKRARSAGSMNED